MGKKSRKIPTKDEMLAINYHRIRGIADEMIMVRDSLQTMLAILISNDMEKELLINELREMGKIVEDSGESSGDASDIEAESGDSGE